MNALPIEPTVKSVIAEYLTNKDLQCQAGMLSKQTATNSRFYCELFARDFGTIPVSQCRRGDLKRWLTMHPEFKSPHTKISATGQIVTCFRWAEEDGLISRCPYVRPKDLPAAEPRCPITREEVRQILRAAKGIGKRPTRIAFRLALWFLWETGVRTCEVYTLRWEYYDDERGCFEMPSKTTAKTGRKRLIALPRRAWRLIRWMYRKRAVTTAVAPMTKEVPPLNTRITDPRDDTAGHVFLNGRGKPWTKDTFGKLFRARARMAGVRAGVSAYCARHGFCCEALEAGIGERQLADYMGHSNTKYISYYGRGVKSKVDYLREVGEGRGR